jgi:hypothetical protein
VVLRAFYRIVNAFAAKEKEINPLCLRAFVAIFLFSAGK